jgi:hypothetical protein
VIVYGSWNYSYLCNQCQSLLTLWVRILVGEKFDVSLSPLDYGILCPLTITESPSLNIFRNKLTHFYKTSDTNTFYNFRIRKFNIIHCQLRNEASNLKTLLFNDFLSNFTNCPNCSGPLEDDNHLLFICPKYNNLRLFFY